MPRSGTVAAINMGAHIDRVPAKELIDRFLPLLRAGADDAKSRLL
jgi:IclR family pca regulon transcriptional regulator